MSKCCKKKNIFTEKQLTPVYTLEVIIIAGVFISPSKSTFLNVEEKLLECKFLWDYNGFSILVFLITFSVHIYVVLHDDIVLIGSELY